MFFTRVFIVGAISLSAYGILEQARMRREKGGIHIDEPLRLVS